MASTAHTPANEMRAIRQAVYGAPSDVLRLETIPRPELTPDKVLIRVSAAAAHAGDWHLIRGKPYFLRFMFGKPTRPTVLTPGTELCGVVEAVGANVKGLSVGDVVFGDVSEAGFGAFADYVCVPPAAVTKKPYNITARQAAASCTSALAALQALRDFGKVEKGHSVLVNGASGGVGSFVVQMAKAFGAKVTAVCHGRKADKVRSLGADAIVDYTQADVTRAGVKYDVIVDTACFRSPFCYAKILNKKGRYLVVGGATSRFFQVMMFGPWMSVSRGVKASFVESKPKKEDMATIADMLEKGQIVPLIDRSYSLEQVAEAITYVEERKVTGKVTIDT